MLPPSATVPDTAAPPRPSAYRRAWDLTLTVVLVAVTAVSFLVASTYAAVDLELPDGTTSMWTIVWILLALGSGTGVCTLVALRRRLPVALVVIASVHAVLFPVGAVAALVGLASVVAHRPVREAWRAGILVTGVTALAVVQDASRPTGRQVLAPRGADGPVELPWWVFAVVAVVVLGIAVGAGLLGRSRQAVGWMQHENDRQVARTQELTTELSRQEERDLIAREVHDTVAHRLSLVSLQAGALEVAAQHDPRLHAVAAAVQSSAHRSLEDLRDLIGVLRDPRTARSGGAASVDPSVTLADLPALLDASRQAGTRMVATVLVDDARDASSALTLATYRIVQEALTNIHKHAPGADVDVRVTGGPGAGLTILVTNELARGPVVPVPGSGSGLTGIEERARLLGGSSAVGPVGSRFVVEVHLPWAHGRTEPTDGARTRRG